MKLRLHKLIWVITALLTGCAPPNRPSIVPMAQIEESLGCARPERLIVMLPGLFDTPQDFVRSGFVDALRQRGIGGRVVIPDAHFGYYESRSVDRRILDDVILPARNAGVREIWLVGVSMGALGSLIFAEQHRDIVQRVFLIGPYPGTDRVMQSIRNAGGPTRWAKQAPDPDDPDVKILRFWHWLATRAPQADTSPAIFYGTGEGDRYKRNQDLLGALIPASARFNADGKHDWPTWRAIWNNMLDALPAEPGKPAGTGC